MRHVALKCIFIKHATNIYPAWYDPWNPDHTQQLKQAGFFYDGMAPNWSQGIWK